jgi:hypothetical protein
MFVSNLEPQVCFVASDTTVFHSKVPLKLDSQRKKEILEPGQKAKPKKKKEKPKGRQKVGEPQLTPISPIRDYIRLIFRWTFATYAQRSC